MNGLDSFAGRRYPHDPSRAACPATRGAEVTMRDSGTKSPGSVVAAILSLLAPLLALAAGCHSLNFLRSTAKDPPAEKADAPGEVKARLPSRYQVRVAPVLILTDYKMPGDLPLFKELGEMRDQIQKDLLLPPATEAVKVYIFETEAEYKRYLKREYEDLHRLGRRAFFVDQPRGMGSELLVFTYNSKRLRQDLRHELTHALLHAVIKDVPQWLDEGLAEHFELPPEQDGVNRDHVEKLRADLAAGKARLSLARLERLTKVEEMTPAEYRESWAWVHLMLRTKPEAKTMLLGYLQQLKAGRNPGPLGPRIAKVFSAPEEALTAHLARLEADLARARADARR